MSKNGCLKSKRSCVKLSDSNAAFLLLIISTTDVISGSADGLAKLFWLSIRSIGQLALKRLSHKKTVWNPTKTNSTVRLMTWSRWSEVNCQ
jgi:hypothetical protein